MTELEELSEFLREDASPDIRQVAVNQLLELTASESICASLAESGTVLGSLKQLLSKRLCQLPVYRCLINICGTERRARSVLLSPGGCVAALCLSDILGPLAGPEGASVQQLACALLANLSRDADNCQLVLGALSCGCVQRLVVAFCHIEHDRSAAQLHRLAHVLLNLSQTPDGRRYLMGQDRTLLQLLLPVVHCESARDRRMGIVGVFRNFSMQADFHEWLLGEHMGVIPHLLLPLAGPESFGEDTDKLPLDLQYLAEDKQREPDLEIRRMLLETLTQLCSTRFGRVTMRDSGAYLILREYHKWETDESTVLLCEQLVNIILKNEDEIGVDDLKSLDTSHI